MNIIPCPYCKGWIFTVTGMHFLHGRGQWQNFLINIWIYYIWVHSLMSQSKGKPCCAWLTLFREHLKGSAHAESCNFLVDHCCLLGRDKHLGLSSGLKIHLLHHTLPYLLRTTLYELTAHMGVNPGYPKFADTSRRPCCKGRPLWHHLKVWVSDQLLKGCITSRMMGTFSWGVWKPLWSSKPSSFTDQQPASVHLTPWCWCGWRVYRYNQTEHKGVCTEISSYNDFCGQKVFKQVVGMMNV